jgi:AraC family transcriptional regulator, regulatory protein of adaptative response / methylated-DNA-[protein]-cysteine methyltransferase
MSTADRLVRTLNRAAIPGTSLTELAAAEGISPFHLQRQFRAWTGLTPQQYEAFSTVAKARGLLAAAHSVLGVTLDLGLSGPSRLHDRFVRIIAMTPGECARGGAALTLGWGLGDSPLGPVVVAWTARGVCYLAFTDTVTAGEALLVQQWPAAVRTRDQTHAQELVELAFTTARERRRPVHLAVSGTSFQVAIWRALLTVPEGRLTTYGALAAAAGNPAAVRAAGTAVGANPISVLIPCHRAIRASGLLGGYHWGLDRKCGLLARELNPARLSG